MTDITAHRLPKADIVGPYSAWPRRRVPTRRQIAAYTGGLATLAFVFHCVLPAFLIA